MQINILILMLIEKYGLKAIPFQSQASESGKYPFVPSESFNELILEIEKIQQQKDSSAIIVQGPQGSGKTATRNGIHNYFSQKSGIAIFSISLSSVDVRDLTWSIVNEAKKQNFVTDEGTVAFANYTSFPNLEVWQLGWNEVRDAGAMELADSKNFPKLKKLDLRGKFLAGKTKETLRATLDHLKYMRIIQAE